MDGPAVPLRIVATPSRLVLIARDQSGAHAAAARFRICEVDRYAAAAIAAAPLPECAGLGECVRERVRRAQSFAPSRSAPAPLPAPALFRAAPPVDTTHP